MMLKKEMLSILFSSFICSSLVVASTAVNPIKAEAFTKEYVANSRKRLEISISAEGINRIEIDKDRILKVVGQQEDYNIEGDSAKGFIFLSTQAGEGEILPITVITEKGLTQDINLNVKEKIQPTTVIIKHPEIQGKDKDKKHHKSSQNIEEMVLLALQDIASGNTRNFSFRTVSDEELKDLSFEVERATSYTDKNLAIFKYEYFEKPEKDQLNFPNSLAVTERGNAIYVVYRI